jgi:hypothetical protein
MRYLPRSYEDLLGEKSIVDKIKLKQEFASFLDLKSVDILKNGLDQLIPYFSDD